jgi:hypothetical protein
MIVFMSQYTGGKRPWNGGKEGIAGRETIWEFNKKAGKREKGGRGDWGKWETWGLRYRPPSDKKTRRL